MKKVSVRGEAEPKPVLGMQEGESCPGAATVHDHAASEDIDLARPCAVAARPHSLPHASLREMRAQRPPLAVFREFESSSFSWAESRGPSSDKIPARSRSSIRAMGIGVLSIVGVCIGALPCVFAQYAPTTEIQMTPSPGVELFNFSTPTITTTHVSGVGENDTNGTSVNETIVIKNITVVNVTQVNTEHVVTNISLNYY
jgi:hypothetical protein